MSEIILKDESYEIIGACFEVYNQKGFGFTEPVYQECLAIELELRKVPFVAQPKIQIAYKNRVLDSYFRPDFVCFDSVIVEIKAVSAIANEHVSQALNYLSATDFKLALLVNFGRSNGLERRRIANERRLSASFGKLGLS